MVDAFKVLRKEYPRDALECLQQAIQRYVQKGNFRRAASHMENAAEVLETELNDRTEAIKSYDDAARWYDEDGAKA
jgi:alpha-soluble NSF attachment protein